jgi:hypothetical protein
LVDCQDTIVPFESREDYLASLRAEDLRQPPSERVHFFREYGTFKKLVEELTSKEKIFQLAEARGPLCELEKWVRRHRALNNAI